MTRIFNYPTMARTLTGAVVVTIVMLVAFGIYYEFKINKMASTDTQMFQQQVQMWVGDNGLIFLVTWICMAFAITLAFLSFREQLPLWLDEFRTWSEFRRDKFGEMIHNWNTVISNPQFSAILSVMNNSLSKTTA